MNRKQIFVLGFGGGLILACLLFWPYTMDLTVGSYHASRGIGYWCVFFPPHADLSFTRDLLPGTEVSYTHRPDFLLLLGEAAVLAAATIAGVRLLAGRGKTAAA